MARGVIGAEPATGLNVVVTIPPLRGIVEPLLPPGSAVVVLMRPGRSEHGYEFTPADMVAIGRANLVVSVGLGLEPQVASFQAGHPSQTRADISLAEALHVSQPVHDEKDGEKHDAKHEDGDEDEDGHHHGSVDPHLWLDPVLVKQAVPALAEAVAAAMKKQGTYDQAAQGRLEKSKAELIEKIDALDGEYRKALAPFKGAKIVTHHAAFGRPAARYGLEIAQVIRVVENSEPTPGRIAAIVDAVREQKVGVIFVEPQFNAAAAERIAKAAGVKLGMLDPLGEGDWFAMMRGNLAALVKGLGP